MATKSRGIDGGLSLAVKPFHNPSAMGNPSLNGEPDAEENTAPEQVAASVVEDQPTQTGVKMSAEPTTPKATDVVHEEQVASRTEQSAGPTMLSNATRHQLRQQQEVVYAPAQFAAPLHARVGDVSKQLSFKTLPGQYNRISTARLATGINHQDILTEALEMWLTHNQF